MTKLTEKERNVFEEIISEDMAAISSAIVEQLKALWHTIRENILHTRGLDTKQIKKDEIQKKIDRLTQEKHDLESELQDEVLSIEEMIELGAISNTYGEYRGATFYDIPVKSKLDYDIVQRIKENIDIEAPAKYLHDLGRSVYREIAMSGTYEQARDVFSQFHDLDFKKYGVDIPPRLAKIKSQNPTLLPPDKAQLLLASAKETIKSIDKEENKDVV